MLLVLYINFASVPLSSRISLCQAASLHGGPCTGKLVSDLENSKQLFLGLFVGVRAVSSSAGRQNDDSVPRVHASGCLSAQADCSGGSINWVTPDPKVEASLSFITTSHAVRCDDAAL